MPVKRKVRVNTETLLLSYQYKLEMQTIIQFKGIVHFEINFWYVLAYLKVIQDVGVFVCFNFDIFRSNRLCLAYVSHIMEVYGVHLKEHAKKSKLNMI